MDKPDRLIDLSPRINAALIKGQRLILASADRLSSREVSNSPEANALSLPKLREPNAVIEGIDYL